MSSEVWVIATLLSSIVLIVVTIVKSKIHPFLALLLASFYVGTLMGMEPLKMVSAMEEGIGGTLGFLAAVIGLGTILGKMMEVSGAAERIGLALQRCRWLSPDVIMVLVGLVCGITLFVEVGVVLLIPLAFSIARKTNTSLLKLAIPLCTALMAVHCIVPPHPAALYVTNQPMSPISWAPMWDPSSSMVWQSASLPRWWAAPCSSSCWVTGSRSRRCPLPLPISRPAMRQLSRP